MKLNLQYISNIIGQEYKTWKPSDIILMGAQTGTGKNHFIENYFIPWISPNKVLFVSNRTNLKRQVKKRLMEDWGVKIPDTIEELDQVKTIGNVVVASYHALQHSSLNEKYKGKLFDLSRFSAIVLDECHFVFSDSGYNNLCRLTYMNLIVKQYKNIIKVFMSATMDEIRIPIIKCSEKGLGIRPKIYEYSTGIDYSYIKPHYINHFNYVEILTNLILNDKTDDKWLIFISDIEDGKQILKELGQDNCSIIKAGTKSDEELESIINHNKFNKKVLIATKALDNGINLKDELLTNLVIMAWDRISTIQMIGRKRIDIENAQEINVYFSTRNKLGFQGLLRKYEAKQADIDLLGLKDDFKNSFNYKYDNKLSKISDDIIYKDSVTKEFMVNPIGYTRLMRDTSFALEMIEEFETIDKFCFARKQYEWLGLEDMFNEDEFIEEVMLNEDIETLESYLESIEGNKLFSDDQQKISDLIINELITIKSKTDYRTKKIKPTTLETILRDQLNLPFAVSKSKKETKGEMKDKRYIIITKVIEE